MPICRKSSCNTMFGARNWLQNIDVVRTHDIRDGNRTARVFHGLYGSIRNKYHRSIVISRDSLNSVSWFVLPASQSPISPPLFISPLNPTSTHRTPPRRARHLVDECATFREITNTHRPRPTAKALDIIVTSDTRSPLTNKSELSLTNSATPPKCCKQW